MKFGKVKREHGRVRGLDEVCDRIVRDCPHVDRIVPGRISRKRGGGPAKFKVQYPTDAGLKCQYSIERSVQEVFLICNDEQAAQAWLTENGIAT
ncbi:MAG: DUF2103 domain-containing protein [Planctomycetota bacterium]